MNRHRLLRSLSVLLVGVAAPLTAQDLEYDFYFGGDRIGETRVSGTASTAFPDAIEVHTSTELRVRSWGFTVFSLESEETEVIGIEGLLEYRSRSKVDGVEVSLTALRRDDGIHVRTVEAGGDSISVVHPLSAFDFTSAEGPDPAALVRGATTTHRVLVLDEGEIRERSYTWIEDEDVPVGDTSLSCRVVLVEDAAGTARRWFAADAYGTLVREEGEDANGPYTLVLTSYRIDGEASAAGRGAGSR